MGSKGLVAYLEGRIKQPAPFVVVNDVPMTASNLPVMEEQIEAREKKIQDYEQKHYLAQHLILSSTSLCLSQKILNLTTAKEMWDAVKHDATEKSSLHQVDILNQLQTMKCVSSADPKTHLAKVKSHFRKMTELCEYLRVTSASVADSTFMSIIISSMPDLYCSTIQMVKRAIKITAKPIQPDDLIMIFIQEVEHCIIRDNQAKNADVRATPTHTSVAYQELRMRL